MILIKACLALVRAQDKELDGLSAAPGAAADGSRRVMIEQHSFTAAKPCQLTYSVLADEAKLS